VQFLCELSIVAFTIISLIGLRVPWYFPQSMCCTMWWHHIWVMMMSPWQQWPWHWPWIDISGLLDDITKTTSITFGPRLMSPWWWWPWQQAKTWGTGSIDPPCRPSHASMHFRGFKPQYLFHSSSYSQPAKLTRQHIKLVIHLLKSKVEMEAKVQHSQSTCFCICDTSR